MNGFDFIFEILYVCTYGCCTMHRIQVLWHIWTLNRYILWSLNLISDSWGTMKEYLNDVRMVGQGDGARNHLNKKKKSEALEHGGACNIQYWKETSQLGENSDCQYSRKPRWRTFSQFQILNIEYRRYFIKKIICDFFVFFYAEKVIFKAKNTFFEV